MSVLDDEFRKACEWGLMDRVVTLLFEKRQSKKNLLEFFRSGMEGACLYGHIEVVKYLLEESGQFLDRGLKMACKGGHIEIVELLLQEGAYDVDGQASYEACKNGHSDIVNLLIEDEGDIFNFAEGLRGACEGGHLELVKQIIKYGYHEFDDHDIEEDCFTVACKNEYYDIVKFFLQNCAIHPIVFCGCFEIVCANGHKELILLFIDCFHEFHNIDYDLIIESFDNIHDDKDDNNHKFIGRVLGHLSKNRSSFLAYITADRKSSFKRKNFMPIFNYLTNRHLIMRDSQIKTLHSYNIMMAFTCKDVATFTTRFVGFG